jgi:hypothetical protein
VGVLRRRLLALAVALPLGAGLGCFLDEIDKAQKLPGAGGTAKKPAAGAAAEGGGTSTADPKKPGPPSGPSWWQTARTLGSEPSNEGIVACEIGGRSEFMQREDCLARGGQPK